MFEDRKPMTDWFARPVLHVTDVEASLRFYVERLGFSSPWRFDEDGRACVAQVDRQGCALILADMQLFSGNRSGAFGRKRLARG